MHKNTNRRRKMGGNFSKPKYGDTKPEKSYQSTQNEPQPVQQRRRFVDLPNKERVINLLKHTPESIVLEMSNPSFGYEHYMNADCMDSGDFDFVHKILELVQKALECNSLKLKLKQLMERFTQSDFLLVNVYRILDGVEVFSPEEEESTGSFMLSSVPVVPVKKIYNESLIQTLVLVCSQIIDLNPFLRNNFSPILDRLENLVMLKLDNNSIKELYERTLLVSLLRSSRRIEVEKKRARNVLSEEPQSYIEMSIMPNLGEILNDQSAFLQENIVRGCYRTMNHYLDVHFRLLREDFMHPLRNGILCFREMIKEAKQRGVNTIKAQKIDSLNVYTNVMIISSFLSENGIIYMIKLNEKTAKSINWNKSKRLMYGSLVCLSSDYFANECMAGTVVVRDAEMLNKESVFAVKFDFDWARHNLDRLPSYERSYTMLENSAYFESYKHVLKALQAFGYEGESKFPFLNELVFLKSTNEQPLYLRNSKCDFSALVKRRDKLTLGIDDESEVRNMKNPETWPTQQQMDLDSSQYEALKLALENNLTLIQGPPGTGKTFIGVKIVQFLIQNTHAWYNVDQPRPILMICYTNHALDQFLESCIRECQLMTGVVRVGGRCQNPLLEKFLLSNLRGESRTERSCDPRLYAHICDLKSSLNVLMKSIEEFSERLDVFNQFKSQRILRFEFLRIGMDDQDIQEFQPDSSKRACNGMSPIEVEFLRWLGLFDDRNEKLTHSDRKPDSSGNKSKFEEKNDIPTLETLLVDNDIEELDDDNDDDGENDERILETFFFETNKSIKKKLEENREKHKYSAFVDMFWNNEEILRAFNSIEKKNEDENDKFKEIKSKPKNAMFVKNYVETAVFGSPEKFSEDEANSMTPNGQTVWRLAMPDRFRLYRYWLSKYEHVTRARFVELHREFNDKTNLMTELKMHLDKSIIERAMIVAMTTTGSSRYSEVLKDIGPRIVIVEEAAEVFEAHIVSSLSKHCQHLILIGDHVQLRPNPTVYRLATCYNLNVSLFERLINNDFKRVTLRCQHRMRPEISVFAKLFYDENISDHESVMLYPNMIGLSSNVYFVEHSNAESDMSELKSKRNKFEATYLSKLCEYLLKQDYEPSRITVITMYLGQLIEIRNELRRIGLGGQIRVCTVDNFQGEENDIVLLSLVRSNSEHNIGFLKTTNRICVAMSRARHGFFCIGNLQMLAIVNSTWREIVRVARHHNLVGYSLKLTCHNHHENDLDVSKPSQFDQRPDGGCQLPCQERLKCGHACPRMCHAADRNHVKFKCQKPCNRIIAWCGHNCQQLCSHPGECEQCGVLVAKRLSVCGHKVMVRCDKEPERSDCHAPCERRVPKCGHRCLRECGDVNCDMCIVECFLEPLCSHTDQKLKAFCYESIWQAVEKCSLSCGQILASCGHLCKSTCGKCFGGRIHEECVEKCDRILFCGHKCQTPCAQQCRPCSAPCENLCVHSRCMLKCSQSCTPCKEKCPWQCEHQKCTRLCYELCDREPCEMPCSKRLKCGHVCVGFCGEPCPQLCRECNSHELTKIFFGFEEDPNARFVLLEDCNHVFESKGLKHWLNERNKSGIVQIPECPRCKTSMRKNLRFSNYIKKQLAAIEQIKLKHIGDQATTDRIQRDFKIENTSTVGKIYADWLALFELIYGLASAHDIFQNDLIILQNTFRIGKRLCELKADVLDYLSSYTARNYLSHLVYEIEKIKTIIGKIFGEKRISLLSSSRVNEIVVEIGRIENLFTYYKFKHVFENRPSSWLTEKESAIRAAFEQLNYMLIKSTNEYKKEERIKQIFAELHTLIELKISDRLRLMVVEVMSVKKGAWFKCPNGHPYCIDRCGGAMETSFCADCRAPIGGKNHQVLESNKFAGEMDGSTRPANSDLINRIEEFALDDI